MCRLTFSEEELARRVLAQFKKGRAFGELVGELQRENPDLEAGPPEWISASDPFLDEGVKNFCLTWRPAKRARWLRVKAVSIYTLSWTPGRQAPWTMKQFKKRLL